MSSAVQPSYAAGAAAFPAPCFAALSRAQRGAYPCGGASTREPSVARCASWAASYEAFPGVVGPEVAPGSRYPSRLSQQQVLQHLQQQHAAFPMGGKRCRDDEASSAAETTLSQYARQLHAAMMMSGSVPPPVCGCARRSASGSTTPVSRDDLYQHCLNQAQRMVPTHPLGKLQRHSHDVHLGVSPTSVLVGTADTLDSTCSSASSSASFVPQKVHQPTFTTPPYANPEMGGHPVLPQAPLVPAAVTSHLPAYLQLASPTKRRRMSLDTAMAWEQPLFLGSTSYHSLAGYRAAYFAEHRADSLGMDDALLRWSQEQARKALQSEASVPPDNYVSSGRALWAGRRSGLPASPGPIGQHISASASSSSQVLDCLNRWMDLLQIPSDETTHFAFHLWSRVASVALSQQRLAISSVLAGCLWVALKLQEHRLVVPMATTLAQLCRISRRELRAAEMQVMSWVDWAPLSKWGKL